MAQTGPVAWYTFDDATQLGRDSAGGSNATQIVGASSIPGKRGNAVHLTNGYLMLPTTAALNVRGGDFTLAVFVRATSTANNRNWFTKSTTSTHQYGLGGNTTVGLAFDGGPGGSVTSTSVVMDGSWHHVAGIKRGTGIEIWVDGQRQATSTTTGTADSGTFAIGRDGPCCEFFNGDMDEAKIWNRALSSSEIAAEAGSAPPCANPGPFTLSSPPNAATGISTTPTLTWNPASGAGSYVVHIGTGNPPSPNNDQSVTGTSFSPAASVLGPLAPGSTYYWAVDAIASCNTTLRTTNTGGVQTFTTAGACALTCTASVPSSATANTGVQFSATATPTTCAGTPSYAWTFGDGGSSSAQNPTHTYAAAGTYNWNLTTTVAGVTCQKSGTISITAGCSLGCSANANTSAAVNTPVPFNASATPSNCASAPTYSWSFGDGTSGVGQSTVHTYVSAGAYTWTMTASSGGATCQASSAITITAPQSPNITFTVAPSRILQGATATLSWTVANATNVTIDNAIGTQPSTGSIAVQPSRTTTYTLTAVGATSATSAVTVRVDPTLQVSTVAVPLTGLAPFSTSFQAVAGGGVPPYTFTWSTGEQGPTMSHKWTTQGQYNVTCTVTDSAGNRTTSSIEAVTVSAPTATGALELLDPNPEIGSNSTTTNPATLLRAPSVTAATADGATIVLLRFTASSSGTVQFTLDAPGDDSGLSNWGADDRMTTVTQHTVTVGSEQQAFAIYHAPSDFVRVGIDADKSLAQRTILLRAQFAADAGGTSQESAQLRIVRPPVVLVHGIWSTGDTWTMPLASDARFPIITRTPWDGYTSISVNTGAVGAAIRAAVGFMRLEGIAVTRADVIAHSMGGLLARAWTATSKYSRPGNYYKGDYHKLITLNTPHTGSPLANIVVLLREIPQFTSFAANVLRKPISSCGSTWIPFVCAPSAMDDLQVGSTALASLPWPHVPTHALVGEAGVLGSDCVTELTGLATWMSAATRHKNVDDFSMDIFGETTHDQVVGSASQKGGLMAPAMKEYKTCDSAHTNATGSTTYARDLLDLLNAPASGPLFATTTPANIVAAVTMTPQDVNAPTIPIAITGPSDMSQVDGGTPLPVHVSVTGTPTVSVIVGPVVLEKTAPPYDFSVSLPPDAIGSTTIAAIAQSQDGSYGAAPPVTVLVNRSMPIESLYVSTPLLTVLADTNTQLHVFAQYADGVLREITDPMLGTQYSSSTSNVAAIGREGIIAAHESGNSTITISNGSHQTAVLLVVVPNQSSRRRAAPH
jgi:PKD repeat protein